MARSATRRSLSPEPQNSEFEVIRKAKKIVGTKAGVWFQNLRSVPMFHQLPAIRQGEARPPSAIDMLIHRRAVSTFSRNVTPEDLPVGGMNHESTEQ
ncbi:uncharacterized protein CPUR_01177 [Claviceps purpurea 20.1]|uniref:Uncharacterized protein n=1 Tax=Claviceps purpurea (strain 20.1) TaxID=1111077 RepID=M1W679_CLAP2|nr:uncharacterized protein CPUR_01177 [Claviceps purpurea 20.1]